MRAESYSKGVAFPLEFEPELTLRLAPLLHAAPRCSTLLHAARLCSTTAGSVRVR